MRRKATTKCAKGNTNIKARENTQLKVVKQLGRPTKTPTGKGLGKAGAKRLGRLLKRAIQDPDESTVTGKVSLPKTPVRLFKHQIQTKAENAPKTNTAISASPHVPQLILNVVSQCKHRGGISMAELKQTLAAGGYNVTKNNRRVNVATQRLINNDKLVRTTRNVTFRLNNEKQTSSVVSPQLKGVLKNSKATTKSSQEAEKSQRQARKTPKPKGRTLKPAAKLPERKTRKPAAKSPKPKGRTRKPAAKSPKPKGRTRKPAAKSPKPKGKTRKPATKSHKPRQQTPKARRKSPTPTGKKSRSATKCVARVRKAPRKAQRAPRRRPKQNQQPYKSSRKSQQPMPRLKTQRRVTRRRAYYY
ncbi:histone H1.01 isoform X2 [Etheostoma spectabile]|uniref:histone H1.01 isoform X2 n=1 Tax=Etheostoma spectabile TaxID=54343 RepID=UPI0013AF61DE|nr:histone H1.01-like isoform X2 [Etheostoma spectabile]